MDVLDPSALIPGSVYVHRRRNAPEYTFATDAGVVHMGEKAFWQWIILGGRWPYELACSNPRGPRHAPNVYQTKHFYDPAKRRSVLDVDLSRSVEGSWGRASQAQIDNAIWEYAKLSLEMMSPGICRDKSVDTYLKRLLSVPQGTAVPRIPHPAL